MKKIKLSQNKSAIKYREYKQQNYEYVCWYKKNWTRWQRNNPDFPPDPKFLTIHKKRRTTKKPTTQKLKERIIQEKLTRVVRKKMSKCQYCESILKTTDEKKSWICWWCVKRLNINGN